MKGGPRPAEMRPLRHGFEMVDRFGGLDFNRQHELVPPVRRCQDEVRKNLDLPDADRNGLVFPDVRHDVMATFESNLQQSNHTVVLQLLADRANQYRAHVTSTREKNWKDLEKEPRIITRLPDIV
jgi:hypothetical protein